MNIVLLGMPGAGKGTVSSWLQEERNYRHLSTGNLLRDEVQAATSLGKEVQGIMNSGKLVSDKLMIALIEKCLSQSSHFRGIIFDGFPRTLAQADALDQITRIDKAIFLQVDEDIVVRRLLERVDDSGEKRDDDSEEVIRKRIRVFFENTQPLIDYYRNKNILHVIDGGVGVEEVRQAVGAIL